MTDEIIEGFSVGTQEQANAITAKGVTIEQVNHWATWSEEDDETPEDPTPNAQRFLNRMIKQIVTDGDWEYGNGLDMTPDAEAFLRQYNTLVAEVTELREKLANLKIGT